MGHPIVIKVLIVSTFNRPSPSLPVYSRPEAPISLTAGQTLTLTCNKSVAASSSVLPISYPTLAGTGLAPGSQVFVGQYLFTGSETSSVYLTVQEVGAAANWHAILRCEHVAWVPCEAAWQTLWDWTDRAARGLEAAERVLWGGPAQAGGERKPSKLGRS